MSDPPLPPLTRESIVSAFRVIQPLIHRTPLLSSRSLSAATGPNELLWKNEAVQRGGAFKARGAFFNVASLTEEERERGVCTHSSGEFACSFVPLALQCHDNGKGRGCEEIESNAERRTPSVELALSSKERPREATLPQLYRSFLTA